MIEHLAGSSRRFGSIAASIRRWCRRWLTATPKPTARKRSTRYALSMECLEGRLVPAVITVNTTADNTTADNAMTLREAVLLCNGTLGRTLTTGEQAQVVGALGNNTIQFSLPSGPQTITLTGGALALIASATITGPGAANLTISGNNLDRVFLIGSIWNQNLSQIAAISGVTITHGAAAYGAGVLSFGTLTINNCVIANNAAGSSGGGGIANVGALTVTNSALNNNSCGASSQGGGFYNFDGTATFTNTTFTGNIAGGTGSSASSGGGFYAYGTVSLTGCTFTGNTAASDAGAFRLNGTATLTSCNFINNVSSSHGGALNLTGNATLVGCSITGNQANTSGGIELSNCVTVMRNCTIANNTSSGAGGGLTNRTSTNVQIINSTFTGNRAINGSSSTFGGGIWAVAALTLQNTIVAGNFRGATGATADDIAGTVNSASANNLIGTGGAGGLVNGTNSNQVGVANPGLGALSNSGGPVLVIPLLAGSPAVNKGNNAQVPVGSTDARGMPRIANTTVDVGAFETQMSSTAPPSQTAAQAVSMAFTLGSFADPTAATGPWNVDVNWGDGSAHTIFTVTTRGTIPSQNHSYVQSGALTATVSVSNATNDSTQAAFTVIVTPTATATLAVKGFPSLVTSGIAGNFTVMALDANGLLATGYRGQVHFTSSDTQATLPADYSFTAADNGVHTFSATLRTVGMQAITATDTLTATITGTQSGIRVNSAGPAVLAVNSTADNTTADSVLTLREAVMVTNGTLGRALTPAENLQIAGVLGNNNTIQFSLPTGPQSITLTGGVLSLTNSMTINGPGSSNLTVNGNNSDRVFIAGKIWSPDTSQVVSISGLTISGGKADYGAGILNFGTLTVNNCVMTGNASGGSGGGALYNVGALSVQNSIFQSNTSANKGPAIINLSGATMSVAFSQFLANRGVDGTIENEGSATISDSSFQNNVMQADGGGITNAPSGNLSVLRSGFLNNSVGSVGGGLFNEGTVMVDTCNFLNNYADSGGGALNNIGVMTVKNSTIKNNTAGSDGGGIRVFDDGYPVSLTLINNTITGNQADGDGGGLAIILGTVSNPAAYPEAYLDTNTIAGNFNSDGVDPSDISGLVDPTSPNNTIGTGGSGGLVNGVNGNKVGVILP
jgi:fibronectin-binding autotransporter adhesin